MDSNTTSTTTGPAHHHHDHGLPIGNEGLFVSHSFLGTFVIGLGFWWWIQSIRNCFRANRKVGGKYEAEASYQSGCCANKFGEGIAKLLLSLVGICLESFTEHLGRHHEYTHYPFYTATLVAGLVDILQSTVICLPDGTDYICHILPFVFQAYCLRAQAYDQPHVTATCRLLSSYLGLCAALAILCEMGVRNNFMVSWIKCFAVMLSGAWTWQMAIILNPLHGDAWDEKSHDNVMYAAVVTAWQMFGVGAVQLITLVVTAKCQGVTADWTAGSGSAQAQRRTASDRDHVQYAKLLNSEDAVQ